MSAARELCYFKQVTHPVWPLALHLLAVLSIPGSLENSDYCILTLILLAFLCFLSPWYLGCEWDHVTGWFLTCVMVMSSTLDESATF